MRYRVVDRSALQVVSPMSTGVSIGDGNGVGTPHRTNAAHPSRTLRGLKLPLRVKLRVRSVLPPPFPDQSPQSARGTGTRYPVPWAGRPGSFTQSRRRRRSKLNSAKKGGCKPKSRTKRWA